MAAVERTDDGVIVRLEDGREITGSHALLAVGSIPQTADLGLAEVGVDLTPSGHIVVDRVSRTSVRGVYAAGDCTGVLPLASVAAMQGRIAMSHALGDAVAPLNLRVVSANIFTDPEIATVGISQKEVDSGLGNVDANILPLSRNPRAKMLGITEGFVKLFSERGSGTVLGGVIVAPRASELIFPVTLAVAHRLNVDQVANTFTVYPSLSGSIAEAARRLHSPAAGSCPAGRSTRGRAWWRRCTGSCARKSASRCALATCWPGRRTGGGPSGRATGCGCGSRRWRAAYRHRLRSTPKCAGSPPRTSGASPGSTPTVRSSRRCWPAGWAGRRGRNNPRPKLPWTQYPAADAKAFASAAGYCVRCGGFAESGRRGLRGLGQRVDATRHTGWVGRECQG
jgi:hypothetical protein